MAIKDSIGAANYEKIRAILARSFPGTPHVTDAMVDSLVSAMQRDYRPEYADLGIEPSAMDFDGAAMVTGGDFPIYMAHATHTRTARIDTEAPMQSEFVGHVPMVRVGLPPKLTKTKDDALDTPIGTVYLDGDHLVGSIELIAEKYADADHLGYTPARVDLITPPRLDGSRFGAIAVYLGYREISAPEPSFFLFEAGTATGDAKMLFFGKTMDTVITQQSWYEPTPFSKEDTIYRGGMRAEGGDPAFMWIQATQGGHGRHYMEIKCTYERMDAMTLCGPIDLTLQAAARVALIGKTMGVPSGIPAEDVFAGIAKTFDWNHVPTMGG
jgi:hypothetical protein